MAIAMHCIGKIYPRPAIYWIWGPFEKQWEMLARIFLPWKVRHIWFTFIPTLNFLITSRLHNIIAKKGVTQPPGSCDPYTVGRGVTAKKKPANFKRDPLCQAVKTGQVMARPQSEAFLLDKVGGGVHRRPNAPSRDPNKRKSKRYSAFGVSTALKCTFTIFHTGL